MKPFPYSLITGALALCLAACAPLAQHPVAAPAPLEINLVALNDFHGHLEPSKFRYQGAADAAPQTIEAGGVATIGGALKRWRAEDPQLLLVGAGDLIGASPAMSSMWADEPSVQAMNMLGLQASATGNHEFDHGRAELLRAQHGGCQSNQPDKACKLNASFDGARFAYLAANVLDSASGKPFLPAYRIVEAHGVKVGLIGAVLKDTASVVLASGIAGLDFVDEADAINRTIPELRAQGVKVFVLLIHQGGRSSDAFDQADCQHLKGPIIDIANRLDPAIKLIVSGHTHTGYLCQVGERTITQAEMGGHVLSRIKLRLDPASGAVATVTASNVIMRSDQFQPDPALSAFLQTVKEKSTRELSRPVARVARASISRTPNKAGESALGNLIADAALAATAKLGAQIGFMNPYGIRKDLDAGPSLQATYGQAQVVQPFGNTLVLLDLTGAQLRALLEGQWRADSHGAEVASLLQVSQGLHYRWDATRPLGQRLLPGSLTLNGVPVVDSIRYRVVVNNFLAEGGDNFSTFTAGTNKLDTQIRDLDALLGFMIERERAGAPVSGADGPARIERVN